MDFVLYNQLVFNTEMYPRPQVSPDNVASLIEAMKSGATLPPIHVWRKNNWVSDGWHRSEAYHSRLGAEAEIPCEFHDYADEAEFLLDSARRNMHGLKLTTHDKTRLRKLCDEFRVSVDDMAMVLNMTVDKFNGLKINRMAVATNGTQVALKRFTAHKANHTLTDRQIEGNRRAPGGTQVGHVQQLITAVTHDILNLDNRTLLERLVHLRQLLNNMAELDVVEAQLGSKV